jgi:hypothetical protein
MSPIIIDVRWRERSEEWLFPEGFERHRRRAGRRLPDELFRAGVQFADGSKATSLGSGLDMPLAVGHGEEEAGELAAVDDEESEEESQPSGPVLAVLRAGGGGQRYSQSFWLWLPPDGPLPSSASGPPWISD